MAAAQPTAAKPPLKLPHPYERFRDLEWDRDELNDWLTDQAENEDHSRAAPSPGVGVSYW